MDSKILLRFPFENHLNFNISDNTIGNFFLVENIEISNNISICFQSYDCDKIII